MEFFKEFKDKIHSDAIKKYLEENLSGNLIQILKENYNKELKILEGLDEKIGNFTITPLNPFSFQDFELFKSIMSGKEIMKTTSLFQSHTPTEEKTIENFLLKSLSHILWGIGFYKLHHKETKEFMGISGINVMKLNEEKTHPSEISIGFFLKETWQGKGLAYSSALEVLRHTLNINPNVLVWASALSNNYASHKSLIRLGLEHKGQVCKYAKDFPVEYFELHGQELRDILKDKK